MKHLSFLFSFVLLVLTGHCYGQASSDDTRKVAEAVELFRKTLVDPDKALLERLTAEKLSYGHSNGLVEDKTTCINAMITGKFNFESLELTNQTIDISDDTAIVRHDFFAHTHDAGKEPGTVRLKVLQIWQKQRGKWLLLARQAARMP